MKAITRYLADDRSAFNTEEDCIKYEKLSKKVDIIMKPLGEKIYDINFSNGEGYIQHDKKIVKKAQKDIVALAIKELKLDKDWKFGSFIGRYIDDSGVNCINSAYSRLSCIDVKGREWGQAYYAFNPDKGTQKPFINKLK